MPDSSFLEAQLTYESLGSLDLDNAIANLDSALSSYSTPTWEVIGSEGQSVTVNANTSVRYGTTNKWVYKTVSGSFTIGNSFFGSDPAPGVGKTCEQSTGGNQATLESAFAPIAEYYSKLVNINETLRKYIGKTAKDLADSDPRLINEERYSNRVHPEESSMPREASHGLIPELRQSSLPYLISISVFMATLSIFLIFQINGFSGQINIPPSVSAWFASPAPDATPFYQNPMVLGGITIIALSGLVIFAVLYFQAKNTNRSRQ
jgi:hypothetical protein